MGSSEEGKVGFYTAEGDQVGGFLIRFSSSPLFALWHCTDWTNLPTGLPTDDEKVWRITLTRSSNIRLNIYCNDGGPDSRSGDCRSGDSRSGAEN